MFNPRVLIDYWYNTHELKMTTTSKFSAVIDEELMGIGSMNFAVENLLLDVDDSTGPEKMQRAAVANFGLLLNSPDVGEFSSMLKQMAAKRRRIQDSDRPSVARAVLERLSDLNDELFSDCMWSIGTLRCTVDDFSTISSSIQGQNSIAYFWEQVTRVSKTADRLCLTRLAIGLGKMGVRWNSLPVATQSSLLNLIQNQNISQEITQQRQIPYESRELATILFTLGQLGVTTDILPEGSLSRVLEDVGDIAQHFTPQGLSNTLNGLARMGVQWNDLPVQAQSQLPHRGTTIVAEMRSDELCSIMQSMAVMKVSLYKFEE
jgi:hypothetical protein